MNLKLNSYGKQLELAESLFSNTTPENDYLA